MSRSAAAQTAVAAQGGRAPQPAATTANAANISKTSLQSNRLLQDVAPLLVHTHVSFNTPTALQGLLQYDHFFDAKFSKQFSSQVVFYSDICLGYLYSPKGFHPVL